MINAEGKHNMCNLETIKRGCRRDFEPFGHGKEGEETQPSGHMDHSTNTKMACDKNPLLETNFIQLPIGEAWGVIPETQIIPPNSYNEAKYHAILTKILVMRSCYLI